MKLGLGIDTGGTFTDAVIYNFENKEILSSFKSPTTIGDLNICINNVLNSIDKQYLDSIMVVSLSTTLVTNACVEGKGARGKLILIGCKREEIIKYGREYGLPDVSDIIFVDGVVDINGKEIKSPDWDSFKKQILDIEKHVDSFGVVQMWGTVNPVYEVEARELIQTISSKPTVCGHELSSKLNYFRRAVSCLLNVRLIPIFNHFLDSVKQNIELKGIKAPLLIVRCDGSVMTEQYARSKPVDTLLSGPAASIAGGLVLSRQKNAVILDIGGTTSDMGIVENESVKLEEQGATIGENKTATSSIDIYTLGIGGDSQIAVTSDQRLIIGPKRVESICQLSFKYPSIKEKIRELIPVANKHVRNIGVFYYLVGTKKNSRIIDYLADGPKDVLSICDNCDISIYNNDLDLLVNEGVIMRCAITPTDIAHCQKKFNKWDSEAAELILTLFVKQFGFDETTILAKIEDKIGQLLYTMIVRKLYQYESKNDMEEEFYEFSYGSDSRLLNFDITCKFPIIGLGAPAYLYLPEVARKLNTTCIIPTHAGVANALGAIAGEIRITEFAEITTIYDNNQFVGYHLQTSNGVNLFDTYEEAEKQAYSLLNLITRENLAKRGAVKGDIHINKHDHSVKAPFQGEEAEEEFLFRFVKFESTGRCDIVKSGIIEG
ncbi:MAG: hydantoinase/oxoprolinase family protein [Clostridia bacterium]|nr:hydantoinase/oxoprolinase family protein [Clostridia bacterium]